MNAKAKDAVAFVQIKNGSWYQVALAEGERGCLVGFLESLHAGQIKALPDKFPFALDDPQAESRP